VQRLSRQAMPQHLMPASSAAGSTGSVHDMTRRRLLWVDDSRVLLSLYKAVFESMGFEVRCFSSPMTALDHISPDAADVAIVDFDMPGMDGGTLASRIKDRCPGLPIILYTGSDHVPRSAQRYVDGVCAKSETQTRLLAMIDQLSHSLPSRNSPRLPRRRHSLRALRRSRLSACKASSIA